MDRFQFEPICGLGFMKDVPSRNTKTIITMKDIARELGVSKVPTIVRQGPPVYIKTTGAAAYGDPVARLELVNSMLNDDGMWEMSKP